MRLLRALCLTLLGAACADPRPASEAPGTTPTSRSSADPRGPVAGPEVPASAHRYTLAARLDEARKRVHGHVRIRFTNTSPQPLQELVFHLYLNAFRDEHSVFMRESRGSLRGIPFQGAGSIALETLRVGGEDVLARAEPELVAGDRTQLRVPLSAPLAPGAELAIESAFVAALPPVFARSGHARDFFAVAQWFPKLAKLEPDGRFESFPYHALGEFYADFADYALELDTASDLTVVASGALVAERRAGQRTHRRFEARHVHDIAFFAGRGFRTRHDAQPGLVVHYLTPPGYERAEQLQARVVRAGLARFGRAFGPYPYPSLSVVLPPRRGNGAAGMEYPGLIVGEAPWWPLAGLPSFSGAYVTAHELAHQWFYGLLASHEVRHPVLDEGLAQWASLDLMRALFGAREGLGRLRFDRFEIERLFALRLARSKQPGLAAYEYTQGEYGASVYTRAALALESIRRAYGDERFARALALYTARQRFRHPTPAELEQSFDGVYGSGFAARTLRPLLFDGEVAAVKLAEATSRPEGAGYRTRISARRTGAVALPTWLALYAPDGRELKRVAWHADRAELTLALATPGPVARAVLDPDRALLLDANVGDQVAHFATPSARPLIAQLLALAQLALSWVGP